MIENTPDASVSTPDAASQSTDHTDSSPTEQAASPSVLDLDTVEKFKWAGREWTPKDFQGQVMMQADYTRKTQALAEERKYYDNLSEDLAYVKKNPAAIAEFKKTYPEKFHAYLDYVSPQERREQRTELPPEVQDLVKFKEEFQEERQKAYMAQIDAMESKYTAKFQLADVDRVLMGAQEWRKQNQGAKEIPEQVWEKLYKSSHESNEKRYKTWSAAEVNKQKQANAEGRDVPAGGGVPAQAPANIRTIKQASNALREHLNSN